MRLSTCFLAALLITNPLYSYKGDAMAKKVNPLVTKRCIPCSGELPALSQDEIDNLLAQLGNGWKVVEGRYLEKKYCFPDFAAALFFTDRIGAIAEEEGHHPDIYLTWGSVTLYIWTHKIDGLTESDFILAAKCDEEMIEEIVEKSLL